MGKACNDFIPSLAKFSIINSNLNIGESNRPIGKVFSDVDKCVSLIIYIKDWNPEYLLEMGKIKTSVSWLGTHIHNYSS